MAAMERRTNQTLLGSSGMAMNRERSANLSSCGAQGGATTTTSNNTKPPSMKLFAAWEDRTPPNCIPRLCSLIVTRLTVLTPLAAAGDISSVSLAVKMQSSKRILRSHEIPLVQGGGGGAPQSSSGGISAVNNPSGGGGGVTLLSASGGDSSAVVSSIGGAVNSVNSISSSTTTQSAGLASNSVNSNSSSNFLNNNNNNLNGSCAAPVMEADLDLNFSLQYPHFIKRDGNRLVIMLQRRKKYKTRTILGFKTLAEGVIRMDAVLQKSMDMVVELHVPGKGNRPGCILATVRAERVSSIPVDHDNKTINNVLIADRNNEYSDEDEEGDFSSGDDNEDGGAATTAAMMRNFSNKSNFRKLDHHHRLNDNDPEDVVMLGQGAQCDSDSDFDPKDKNARTKISRQRNFKQKIVALLKRFKVPEEIEESRHAGRLRPGHQLDELFQELDELSCGDGEDSGPDVDSIGSTPKPSLRPFFTNSRNTLHEHIKGEG